MNKDFLFLRHNIGLKRRYWAECRFRAYGVIAVFIGLFFLFALLWSIISQGYTAFFQSEMTLSVYLDEEIIDPTGQYETNPQVLMTANYPLLVRNALAKKLGIDQNDKVALRDVNRMFSNGVRAQLREMVIKNPKLIGTTQQIKVLAAGDIDSAYKGKIDLHVVEKNRKVSNRQVEWIRRLASDGTLYKTFNFGFFTFGASSRAETAGLGVAIIGSFYMIVIVLMVSLPIGIATALYLEEYARKNKFTDFIEVNINNLAAVPSIVFGLLGLAVFVNFFGLPRSASFVGGLVLALMTLPTVIISTRSALRAVPLSIRAAALGLGASKTQMIFHHVVPLAAPGILTGTIIGVAQALGETAPLLLIGMVAFVVNIPATPMDPATALPVQIFMWASEAERAFVEKSSGAIIVLMIFLAIMNISAVFLRRRFEQRR
ncbi:phosphate ABC transporter permease PstA [Bartonella alsatica]|uniref:Phosphate transport system permease protein PstA n=2 Tax=Bartonella alsatica TaxID=52764 RepID=J1IW70_9HYPH|nr:phosphate ABC transporter permease PstA [Bartonella alsatica]EJF75415.1 phosphate ABC transporter, permease PstA [Bartonella alsatica IBS 382]QLC52246.1 phosphate ABC transporter permease PstA [Bartonella alsatica]